MRKAFFCASDRPAAMCTGTCARPSLRAAFSRVCPANTVNCSSTTTGTRKPNSRMLAATASTAPSLRRGLRA